MVFYKNVLYNLGVLVAYQKGKRFLALVHNWWQSASVGSSPKLPSPLTCSCAA